MKLNENPSKINLLETKLRWSREFLLALGITFIWLVFPQTASSGPWLSQVVGGGWWVGFVFESKAHSSFGWGWAEHLSWLFSWVYEKMLNTKMSNCSQFFLFFVIEEECWIEILKSQQFFLFCYEVKMLKWDFKKSTFLGCAATLYTTLCVSFLVFFLSVHGLHSKIPDFKLNLSKFGQTKPNWTWSHQTKLKQFQFNLTKPNQTLVLSVQTLPNEIWKNKTKIWLIQTNPKPWTKLWVIWMNLRCPKVLRNSCTDPYLLSNMLGICF